MTPSPAPKTLIALAASALLAACSGSDDGDSFATPLVVADAARACAALAGQGVEAARIGEPTGGAVVTSATLKAAVADAPNAGGTATVLGTPEYCELLVQIRPADPAAPVINSQVNLPTSWNGKKLQFGGAGYNGTLVNGLDFSRAAPPDVPRPITRGYMTAGTDSGHQNQAGVEIFAFALNREALVNFAYAAYKKTHDVAVALGERYYRHKPMKSYYMGGSEGGREGMVMAQRYPGDYDGIVSIDPVMNWTGLQTFGNWIGGIRQSAPGAWLGGKTQLVHDTVAAACDALDGIADGVVSQYRACKPLAEAALAAKACPSGGDEGPGCLSAAQLAVIQSAHAGYRFAFPVANGMQAYAGFGFGGEGLAGNWSNWLVGTAPPTAGPAADGINQVYRYGNGYVRYFIAQDAAFDPLAYDPAAWRERVLQVSQWMDATDTDLSAFRARGGRLILREDLSDTAQSPWTGLNYRDAVAARMGAAAVEEFFVAYAATGLPHTSGGVAAGTANAPAHGIPGRVDLLAVLEDWVEKGIRPAAHYTLTNQQALAPFATIASKPMCRYPQYPRYQGGDPALAASYRCADD
ncbi:tannase/feruloyl esterase family alpha/beta hydrolase [Pseudorhodoferax sp.]|uniref:tannase/feruloyl esterase family alpha/beta hydrolase n=1 Tax=Pseudorhodoferax sp. TaxID=1993553 RepID=UPI0039E381EF